MKDDPEVFEFTEEATMNTYLGVDIYTLRDRKRFTLYQPLLIHKIIQDLGFGPNNTKGATNNTTYGYLLLNKD